MTRIKIISNPYKKEIKYQQWNDDNAAWVDISFEDHKETKLVSKELTASFFPFKAKEIVEQIVNDYQIDGEEIELYFEGSADEYSELQAVCSEETFAVPVRLFRSVIYLENARDILPEVKKLFQEMSPLISESEDHETIKRDLRRFEDASSDVVPVCVMGNYSSGKSTFINALIGSEILPEGDDPVTAKVFKIARSKFNDRASVKLKYGKNPIVLIMTADDTYFEDLKEPNDLTEILTEQVIAMNEKSIAIRMNKAIKIINDFQKDGKNSSISDLIEIEVPFVNGILARSPHPFVLFDTPGSNSVTNTDHLRVLKEAMHNMTNGLPVFVVTSNTLDSTDNEKLYKLFKELDEQLDNRFNMIVVNKADEIAFSQKKIDKEEEKLVMRQAVPKNLYRSGIFYVSSILGLGSKTNGEFISDSNLEKYEDQEKKYSDPQNKRYRQLYLYNILPDQIKQRSTKAAQEEKNLIYANSGLFSVETEIENFAGKYSAYNKCYQSKLFLSNIIDSTKDSIDSKKNDIEETRQMIQEKLNNDKDNLVNKLTQTAERQKLEYRKGYKDCMSQFIDGTDSMFSSDNLKLKEKELTEQIEEEKNFIVHTEKTKDSLKTVGKDFFFRPVNQFIKNDFHPIDHFVTLKSDIGNAVEDRRTQDSLRIEIDRKVSDQLLMNTKEKFKERLRSILVAMEEGSQRYWTTNTEKLRNILIQIVTGSSLLTPDRQNEVKQIIIEYKKLTFDVNKAESIFKKEDFELKLAIGNFVIWHSNHLNLDKLSRMCNETMNQNIQAKYRMIEESHRESAYQWIDNLLDKITMNIVSYSPELSKQAKKIESLNEQIQKLADKQEKLESYTIRLDSMMDWKFTNNE